MITQQPPSSVTAGAGFGLTVQAEDSLGNPVSSFSGTVTVRLANNPGGTTLGGTLVVAASGGVATFSGLTIPTVGSGYTLFVSASGPTSTISSAITVTSSSVLMAARPSHSTGVKPGGTTRALAVTTATPSPSLVPLVLDSPDFWHGLGFRKRSRRF